MIRNLDLASPLSNEGVECPYRMRTINCDKDYREVIETDIHAGAQEVKTAVGPHEVKAHFVRLVDISCARSRLHFGLDANKLP